MYAIIETGGKQYKVAKDDEIFVEKLNAVADETITLDKVLVFSDDKKLKLGAPYLKDVTVSAKVIKNGKAKKITVMTYKAKKNEKKKMGHRQPYTKLLITDILTGKKEAAPADAAAEKPAKKVASADAAAEKPAKKAASADVAAEKPAKKAAPKKAAKPKAEKEAE